MTNVFFEIAVTAAILPFAFWVDWLIYSKFGNTLGKAALGIYVRNMDGSKLNADEYFRRNRDVYIKGFAFGIPVVHLFTVWEQGNSLTKVGAAMYDINKYQVLRTGNPWLQAPLFVVATIIGIVICSICLVPVLLLARILPS